MSRSYLVLTVVFGLSASLAIADDKPTGDLAKMQGAWTGIAGPNKDVKFTATFEGKKVSLVFDRQGEEIKLEGEVEINDKLETKTIDWVKFTSPAGDALPTNLGIYKFEGEKNERMVCCNGGPGNDRPTEFKAGEGGPPSLQVLTRVAAVDKGEKDAIKGDLAKFQGDWKTKLGDLEIKLTIKEKKVVAEYTDGNGTAIKMEGEIAVNESTKPASVDFLKFHGGDGNAMQDNLGIYTIDKDTITICLGGPGNERPTEFKSGDNGQALITLEKLK